MRCGYNFISSRAVECEEKKVSDVYTIPNNNRSHHATTYGLENTIAKTKEARLSKLKHTSSPSSSRR